MACELDSHDVADQLIHGNTRAKVVVGEQNDPPEDPRDVPQPFRSVLHGLQRVLAIQHA